MQTQAPEQLVSQRCQPCEGGVAPCSLDLAAAQVERLNGWRITHDGKRIRRDWTVGHFQAALDFFNLVGELAEDEGHHPDLHVEGYRNVWIELWTHAIGGLSENDFILAAKIDRLPVELKAPPQ